MHYSIALCTKLLHLLTWQQ